MANKPYRVQRKRTDGWTMPPNTVYVGRSNRRPGTGFGNPFDWKTVAFSPGEDPKEKVTDEYRRWLAGHPFFDSLFPEQRQWILSHLHELRGKNLACWCKPDDHCHAGVLLELAANQEARR